MVHVNECALLNEIVCEVIDDIETVFVQEMLDVMVGDIVGVAVMVADQVGKSDGELVNAAEAVSELVMVGERE